MEPPRRTGFGAAVSVKARSAEAETVVVTVAELLAGLGSVSVAVMEALLVMRPADVGLTMMVTVAVAALIWFGIISALQGRLSAQADKMLVAQGNLNLIKAGIAKEAQFNEEIELSKQEFLGFEAKMAQGDLMVQASVNGSEPLAFKVDTGFGITTVHPSLVESFKLRRAGQMTITGADVERRLQSIRDQAHQVVDSRDFAGAGAIHRQLLLLRKDCVLRKC